MYPRRPGSRLPFEFLIPTGFVVVVVTCAIAALDCPPPETGARVAVMAAVVGVFAGWARSLGPALAVAAMAWLFTTGFLVNTAGELTFAGQDFVRLAVLLGVTLLGGAYGVRARRCAASAAITELPVFEYDE